METQHEKTPNIAGYFALSVLGVLVFWNALMMVIVSLPAGDSGLGAFAQEFRRWCFRYDPKTDSIDWAYLIPFITVPMVLGGVTVIAFYTRLKEAALHKRAIVLCGAASLLIVLVAGSGFYYSSNGIDGLSDALSSGKSELPFPADKLRTSYNPPDIDLVNQENERVTLDRFRGKVVVLTGIYATCGNT